MKAQCFIDRDRILQKFLAEKVDPCEALFGKYVTLYIIRSGC